MLKKRNLLGLVLSILNEKDYDTFLTHGCFDIVAKRKAILVIKILSNIDGLLFTHASSIKAISHFLSAYPFIISLVTNRSHLLDGIIYFRFGLPVVTPKTFEKILEKREVKISTKGKHVAEIKTDVLRRRRAELNLSLKKLASLVGISKKAMYEIENKRVNPSEETIEKLEQVLGVKLKKSFEPEIPKRIILKPKDRFEKRISVKLEAIGIDNSTVYSTTFNLIGKTKFSLISVAKKKIIPEKLQEIKTFSEFLSIYAFGICKHKIDANIPILTDKDLRKINSPEELAEAIEA